MSEFIKLLSGHSGCKLALYKECGQFYIRKSSGNAKYNSRLKKQFIKQKKFLATNIKKPEIIRYGTENELFYFDMEFLNCKTFAEYISTMNPMEIATYIDMLFDALPINTATSFNSPSIFIQKLNSLDKDLPEKTTIERNAFDMCQQWTFDNIPLSYCHGDLTLENILITASNQIYLIDFLDSFCNSWMIDIAKLLQDLEIKWSYRKEGTNINRDIRLLIAKETLLNRLRIFPRGQMYLRNIYYILLLNLLRILPYTKDQQTKEFLQTSLSKTIFIIQQEVL